jgi:hypothetical protein
MSSVSDELHSLSSPGQCNSWPLAGCWFSLCSFLFPSAWLPRIVVLLCWQEKLSVSFFIAWVKWPSASRRYSLLVFLTSQWAAASIRSVMPPSCQIISLFSVVLTSQFIFLLHRVTLILELLSPVVCFNFVLKEIQFGAFKCSLFRSH